MNLVIVESPTKARKLSSYLGSDFKIEASVGHVRDLPSKSLSVDVENNFEPQYEISDGKKTIVRNLKKLAKQSKIIYLAMDPDREGEAIAWHIQFLLEEENKNKELKFVRATFHEITKTAVLKAIENPGQINLDLVDAQQARRVVDRLVGYKLSPVLWKKVRRGLSAGRVQSVALRLIVEKEREIEAFIPQEYWELDVALNLNKEGGKTTIFKDKKLIENLPEKVIVSRVLEINNKKYKPKSAADVTAVVQFLPKADFRVKSLEKKERKRASFPPFTTSTLQQAAANRLGMTAKQTMRFAQVLYEEGLITYHRTDSVNLSKSALEMARSYITKTFGQEYLPASPRYFKGKSRNAQEAHEAIRVTDPAKTMNSISKRGKLTDRHLKLYDLIWRKFLASQMETSLYDQTTIITEAKNNGTQVTNTPKESSKILSVQLKTTGSVLKFDGWMKLFPGQGDRILPHIEENQKLYFRELNSAQKFTQPPARYNDASLVKELEKKGIGRPSTYASIISVIVTRGYTQRQAKRFFATAVGKTVSDFLVKYFKAIMDYDFTAEMEEDLDRIARGEKKWRQVVGDFYKPLEKQIDEVIDKAERMQVPVEKTGEICPDCLADQKKGKLEGEVGEIVIRSGRFGKFKSCSKYPECKFTENIVVKLNDIHCPLCETGDVIVRNSRWGKQFFGCSTYPKCDWASWKKPVKGEKLTKQEWVGMQAARKARAEARAKKFGKKKTGSKKKVNKKIAKKKSTAKYKKKRKLTKIM